MARLKKMLSPDFVELIGNYSNACSCMQHYSPSSSKTDKCSLTTLMKEGGIYIDKQSDIVSISRPDESHVEIVGLSSGEDGLKRTYFFKPKGKCSPFCLEILLPKRPRLGIGMVGAIPMIGVGIESDTLNLSYSEDDSLIVHYKVRISTIVLAAIPVYEEYEIWVRCKKNFISAPR